MKTNEQLQQDVIEALKWEPQLTSTDIGIAVRDGVVTLTGFVDAYTKKIAAEKAVKNVTGVRGVAEELQIRLDGKNRKSDTELATAAIDALRWCSTVPDERIKVTVDNGWIKLEGEVEWAYQRDEAKREIEDITGVRGISNLITVKPVVKATDVKAKIQKAFERSATIDASHIGIDVNGSIITLRGPVHSWSEHDDAEQAAWSAPGVTEVRNNLSVRDIEQGKLEMAD